MLFVLYLRNLFPKQGYKNFLLCFLLEFYIFGFSCRSMIHFELIFVYATRKVWIKVLLTVSPIRIYNCSSTICWKDYPFPTELPLRLPKITCPSICWSISGLSVGLFLDSLCWPYYQLSILTLLSHWWLLYLSSKSSNQVVLPFQHFYSF